MSRIRPDVEKIRTLLAQKALTREELSDKASVSTSTLDNIFGTKEHMVYRKTLERIANVLDVSAQDLTADNSPVNSSVLPRIRLGRFPTALGQHFLGRETELKQLDTAWQDPKTHIVVLTGIGGIGKTSLIKYWLDQRRSDYRGAKKVFAWSFAGQSRKNGLSSSASDKFITEALEWFGDANSYKGSWDNRAYRLAEYFRQEPSLLILDGLEALQNPPGTAAGRFAEGEPLLIVLMELAQQYTGLCLISSRITLKDLSATSTGNSLLEIPLKPLSDDLGEQLLRHIGVCGDDTKLRAIARDYWGHPLCLTLLGHYLTDVYEDKHVRHLKPLTTVLVNADQQEEGHAYQIMMEYSRWLDEEKLAVLRILSLFNSSVEFELLEYFGKQAQIDYLTNALQDMDVTSYHSICASLRKSELLISVKKQEQYTLDLHPVVRTFFREQLKQTFPSTYQNAQKFWFSYFCQQASEKVMVFEDLFTMHKAIYHGCEADLQETVFDEIIWKRMLQGYAMMSLNTFGVGGSDWMAAYRYFSNGIFRKDTLNSSITSLLIQSRIFFWIGVKTRFRGNLENATELLETAILLFKKTDDTMGIRETMFHLSRCYFFQGKLIDSIVFSKECISLCEQTNKKALKVALNNYAAVLHCTGEFEASLDIYKKADCIKVESELLSLQEIQYCHLLLDLQKYDQVAKRIESHTPSLYDTPVQKIVRMMLLFRIHLHDERSNTKALHILAKELYYELETYTENTISFDRVRGLLLLAKAYRHLQVLDKAASLLQKAKEITDKYHLHLLQVDCSVEQLKQEICCGKFQDAQITADMAESLIKKNSYFARLPIIERQRYKIP